MSHGNEQFPPEIQSSRNRHTVTLLYIILYNIVIEFLYILAALWLEAGSVYQPGQYHLCNINYACSYNEAAE